MIIIVCIILFQITQSSMKQASKILVFKPKWQNQGVGARVIRIVGNEKISDMNPFLMLDFFKVKLPAGFPDHPHRGFQTVTYMLSGSVYHEDFKGHKGKIGPGDLQWMTAGKGIYHSEMPASFTEQSTGFQLWINLKAKDKMVDPHYQEFKADQIPILDKEGARVKVISGQWSGVKGPIIARQPAYYFDVSLHDDGHFTMDIPKGWNSFIFVFEGEVTYNNSTTVPLENVCTLDRETEKHHFTGKKGRFVLIAGETINEPIAKYGPVVMNTQKEIQQAFSDLRNEVNGFEGAEHWSSKIRHLADGLKPQNLDL